MPDIEGFGENWGNRWSGDLPDLVDVELNVLDNTQIFAGLPSVVTVSTFTSTIPDDAVSRVFNCFARAVLEFGAGKVMDRVEFDWGGSVSVPANRISLKAKTYAPRRGIFTTNGELLNVQLGAMLALGSLSRGAVYTSVATTAAADVIPKYARRLFLTPAKLPSLTSGEPSAEIMFPDPDELQGLRLVVSDFTDVPIVAAEVTSQLLAFGLPIPAHAKKVRFYSATTWNVAILRYELSL